MKWFGSSEKKESEDYEKKYLARYKKQQKPKQKKNTAKENKIQTKDFFRILYLIILQVDRGPKLGRLIEDMGIKEVADTINNAVNSNQKEIDKGMQDDL